MIIVHPHQCVLSEGLIFICAEQYADGWTISLHHDVFLVPANIGIELADIFMAHFFELELNQNVAFNNAMIEHKVRKKMFIADEHSLLAGFKTKPMDLERLSGDPDILSKERNTIRLGS